jgi:hypothetical protein
MLPSDNVFDMEGEMTHIVLADLTVFAAMARTALHPLPEGRSH